MTQAIAKYAAKKMLSSEMNKYKDKKVESDYVSNNPKFVPSTTSRDEC